MQVVDFLTRRSFVAGAAMAVLALVAASCAELGEPYLGATPAAPSTTQPAGVAADPDNSDGQAQVDDPISQGLPPRPDDYVPQLIISTPDGPFLTEDGETSAAPLLEFLVEATTTTTEEGVDPIPAPSTGVVMTADDLLRGFVTQEDEGAVRWYPAESDAGQIVNDLGGMLFDVGYTNSTPEAILLAGGRIERVRLVDLDRVLLSELLANEELLDLSTTGNLTVLVVGNEDCGELRFVNRLGETLDLGGPDDPTCEVTRRPTYGSAALSPDGEAVAYTKIEYRPDGVERSTTLIAQELGSGDPLFEPVEVGRSGQVVESLTFDGERAALLRRTNAGSEVVIIEDGDVRVLELVNVETPRSVTFARLPVTNQS